MVNKNKIQIVANILMFVDFLIVAGSGFILKYVYPAGKKSGQAGVIFLLDRFGWLKVHDVTTILFLIFVLIHLILNWVWIKSLFRKKEQNFISSKCA